METENNITKKWKELHRDEMLQYNKEWHEKNKVRHLEYMAEKVPCDCGKMVARCNIQRHKRSSLHTRKLEQKNSPELQERINKLEEEIKMMKERMI